jgi:hypothetical protein
MARGGLHHRTHFVGGERKDDDIGRAWLVPGFAVTVLFDLCGGGRAAVADARAEIGNESRARVSGKDGGQR